MTRDQLVIVPRVQRDFTSCILSPGSTHMCWPVHREIRADMGILLEAGADSWIGRDPTWIAAPDQDWPTDAARMAASLGFEPSLTDEGLPLIGKEILELGPGHFWQSLSVAFAGRDSHAHDRSAWQRFHSDVLRSLHPEDWLPPPAFHTLLHVDEGNVLSLITRSRDALEVWLAQQIEAWDVQSTSIDRYLTIQCSRWLIEQGDRRGVRLEELAFTNSQLSVTGTWGKGNETLIQDGDESGDPFEITWW